MKRGCVSVVTSILLTAAVVFAAYPARYAARAQSSTPSGSPIVDFPSLVGKSREEVEALFGKQVESYDGPDLEWFCRCEEARRYKVKVPRVLVIGFRKDRAVSFSYALHSGTAPETPEELLLMVGLDARGIAPSQTAQDPTAGASGGPFGGLMSIKKNYLLWTGEVSGVDWNFIVVRGPELRGSGSLLRPKNWRTVKRKYNLVIAHAAEAL